MISNKYSFSEFVNEVKEKDISEIISLIRQEKNEAKRRTESGVRGAPKAREEGCASYEILLSRLEFFLLNGIKPSGILDTDFYKFKPIIESLVNRGNMKGSFWLTFFK